MKLYTKEELIKAFEAGHNMEDFDINDYEAENIKSKGTIQNQIDFLNIRMDENSISRTERRIFRAEISALEWVIGKNEKL